MKRYPKYGYPYIERTDAGYVIHYPSGGTEKIVEWALVQERLGDWIDYQIKQYQKRVNRMYTLARHLMQEPKWEDDGQ